MAIIRPPIYEGQVLEAAKSFRCSGRDFKAGDIFPYTRMSIAWRRVRQMYDCGRIRPVMEDKKPQTTSTTKEELPEKVNELSKDTETTSKTAMKTKKTRKKVARERKGD